MDAKNDDRLFDPMIYDALLELATRIGGRYVAWSRDAPNETVARHWDEAHIEMQRQVRLVDPYSRSQIEAKRAELRELWKSLPETQPDIAIE